MKIMIDTNIVISAVLFPNGKAAQAFIKHCCRLMNRCFVTT